MCGHAQYCAQYAKLQRAVRYENKCAFCVLVFFFSLSFAWPSLRPEKKKKKKKVGRKKKNDSVFHSPPRLEHSLPFTHITYKMADKCQRCNKSVYANDQPCKVNGIVFHGMCFKCKFTVCVCVFVAVCVRRWCSAVRWGGAQKSSVFQSGERWLRWRWWWCYLIRVGGNRRWS